MAPSQFVPKKLLFDLIRQLFATRETGLLSILTDTRRSVMLKFSEGKIIHSYCRTKDIADAIGVLNECELVKFTYVRASMEHNREIMPADAFLQLVDSDAAAGPATADPRVVPIAPATNVVEPGPPPVDGRALRDILTQIALDYVGPVADVVVDEALENTRELDAAIQYIADLIPDEERAFEFRASARERLPTVSLE